MEGSRSTSGGSRRLAGLSSVIGTLVAVAGLAFVVRTIAKDWDDTKRLLEQAEWSWLGLAVPVALLGMTLIAVPWRRALRLFGADVGMAETFTWYFPGQLGKYVPGTIWAVIGRGELANRGGVARPAAYGSVALSLATTYLGAALTVLLLIPAALTARGIELGSIWVVIILPVGVLMLHPAVLQRLVALGERVLNRDMGVMVPEWRDTVGLVLRHIPAWLVIGTATWLVAQAFWADPHYGQIMFAAVLSWIVGFIVVPVPGGIGVREAAFTAAATSLPDDVAATVAIVTRLCFIAADLIGAGLVIVLGRRLRVSGIAPSVPGRAPDVPPEGS